MNLVVQDLWREGGRKEGVREAGVSQGGRECLSRAASVVFVSLISLLGTLWFSLGLSGLSLHAQGLHIYLLAASTTDGT